MNSKPLAFSATKFIVVILLSGIFWTNSRLYLLVFVSYLQTFFLSSTSVECPEKPTGILRSDNVQSITLTNNPTTQSGFISSQEAVGYTFEAEKGYEINYETEDNLCIWIYTPRCSGIQRGSTSPYYY